jgi:hypothetical protein
MDPQIPLFVLIAEETMFRSQWLRNVLAVARSRKVRRRLATQGRRLPQRTRLFLEPLEERTLLSATWTPIGPAPIVNGQIAGGGPVSGRITGIAADPKDANTVYIAAAGGGIWKTTNETAASPTWTPLTDNLSDSSGNPIPLFMGAVAETDDTSGNQIVYAGTGEANNGGDNYYGEGILVSKDGGTTWNLTNAAGAFTGETVSKIAIDPSDPSGGTAYAAVSDFGVNGTLPGGNLVDQTGIWKTTNFGQTWTNVTGAAGLSTSDPWSDVVIDPHTPTTIYAAEGNPFGSVGNGVYKSTDGGKTWNLLTNAPYGSNDGRITLALYDDGTTNELFVSVANPSTGGLYKMEKSTNGGSTFTDITSNTGLGNYLGTQGWYDTTLIVDPNNANYIYAAGDMTNQGPTFSGSPLESFDGGSTWKDIATDSNGNGPHTDAHAVAFDANGNLLEGDDGGIWRLNNPTNPLTQTWSDLNTNLQITQFYGIAVDPTVASVVWGGAQDNGTQEYTGALGWTMIPPDSGDGGITRIDPTNHTTIYQEYVYVSLRISTDDGVTWNDITSGIVAGTSNGSPIADFIAPYVLDASGNIYYGTDYLNFSSDQGTTWSQIGTPKTNNFNAADAPIDAIAVNPVANSNVVYVSAGGHLFVTKNAQAGGNNVTWTQIDLPGGAQSGSQTVHNTIAVDPSDSTGGTAYAVVNSFTGGGKHVYKTTNFGATWTDISGNLPNTPVDSVAVSPDGKTVYVGTDVGAYSTTNGGTTWAPLGTGLPNAQVVEIEDVPSLNVLAVGTHGRGAWELSTATPIVTTNPKDETVTQGQTATFTAAASSVPAATVQWQVYNSTTGQWDNLTDGTLADGTVVSGSTTDTLTLSNVQPSQDGTEYQAVFSNGAGSSTTTAATLHVQYAPIVTAQPSDQTVDVGQTATFTATAAANPSTITVQWQVSTDDGKDWTAINNATSTTLTLNNVTASMNGYEYEAVFSNSIGSTTTTAATLSVQFAPTVATNGNPSNLTVTQGQAATFTATASANPAATVQWQVSSDGGVTWAPLSTGGNVTVATSTTLALTTTTLTLTNVSYALNNNDEYEAVFTNSLGSTPTTAATLTVQTLPAVTTQPSAQTATAGTTATFTAAASGSPTPTVQWQVSTDGGVTWTNISGATSTTLTVNNVLPSQDGNKYQAVFTNAAGTVTTSAAVLTVLYAPIVVTNPSNLTVTAGQTAKFAATANADPTATVQWQVSSNGGVTWTNLTDGANVSGSTSTVLTLSNVSFSLNDDEYEAVFSNGIGTPTTTTAATLTVYTPPAVTANPSGETASVGSTAFFTAAASGNPAPTVQWQLSTDGGQIFGNISGATSPTLQLTNVQEYQNGYEYQAVFSNVVGTVTTSAATLTVPYAPTVTINPSNQTVTASQSSGIIPATSSTSQTATFTAAANGSPAPAVQWQYSTDGGNSWTAINNATSPTLTISNVLPSLNGYEYEAVFSNSQGTATTSAATLIVLYLPAVTANPSNLTVVAGQKATFTAAAVGNPMPTVQWQVSTDGGTTWTNINGAISPTLTLVGTTTAMNGYQYQAVFTNSSGSTTTSAATLTVNPAVSPYITVNPGSQTVSAGANTVTFTAAANGSPAPTVQWQVSTDGGATWSNIPGATNTTLTLNSTPIGLNGNEYQAVFSNFVGTATSIAAKLTVNSPSSSSQGPALNVPPLLALINTLLGGIETINANGTETIVYSLFGYPLIVATYDSSGHFVSATLLGFAIPNSIWFA